MEYHITILVIIEIGVLHHGFLEFSVFCDKLTGRVLQLTGRESPVTDR